MTYTKETIIEALKQSYPHMATEYGLKKIGIFGSYARGEQNDKSDIDIIAEFQMPIGLKFIEFAEYLEELFGKKTGVITPTGVDSIRNQNIVREIKESVIYV